MTPEQERVAFPENVDKSAAEINDVRRKLLALWEDKSQPSWKRWAAVEAASVLTWVMVSKQAGWEVLGGSVAHPLESLLTRNVSPCVGTPGFCTANCEHDWKGFGDGLTETCPKCMRHRNAAGVTDEQVMQHYNEMARKAGIPDNFPGKRKRTSCQ